MAEHTTEHTTEYVWADSAHAHNHRFIQPTLERVIGPGAGRSLIDLGCGNGSLTAPFAGHGFDVVGVDIAGGGIEHAIRARPDLDFRAHDIADPLPADLFGRFDVALSAEVIEHLFLPRRLFDRADEALAPAGRLVLTTPYHGYLKNLALAVTGRFDRHWSPNWDHGHIKFFSRRTLTDLAHSCGYRLTGFHRVGRVPPLAMSMIAVFEKGAR